MPKRGTRSVSQQLSNFARTQGLTPMIVEKVKRDTTSPTTIVAQNMCLVNQANVADFLEGLDSSDHYEPMIVNAMISALCYHSGPGRVRFFLGESHEGATLVDTNGLDTTVDSLMDTAYGAEPYEYIPITPWLNFRCVAGSTWTVNRNINITKYVKKFMATSFEETAERPNLNLIAITNQGAAVGCDIHTFLTVQWTYAQGIGSLKTLA